MHHAFAARCPAQFRPQHVAVGEIFQLTRFGRLDQISRLATIAANQPTPRGLRQFNLQIFCHLVQRRGVFVDFGHVGQHFACRFQRIQGDEAESGQLAAGHR